MQKLYSPRLFRFLTIFIMAILCLLFNQLTKINFVKINLPKDRPEYNGFNANGVVYGKDGNLVYHLKSERIWQFPDSESLLMANFTTVVYSESSSDIIKYFLTANDGWINYNKKFGFLGSNALLKVNSFNPKQVITIYGRDVNVDLGRNYFYSESNVRATQNKSIITGKGFSYDQNQSILKINSNVNITYAEST